MSGFDGGLRYQAERKSSSGGFDGFGSGGGTVTIPGIGQYNLGGLPSRANSGGRPYEHGTVWEQGQPNPRVNPWDTYFQQMQGQIANRNAMYDSALARLSSGYAGYGAAANAQMGAARAARDNALARAQSDYGFGVRLRDQEEYRQVDLGRERNNNAYWNAGQTWAITQDDLNNRRLSANALWDEMQRYNTQQRGFAGDRRDLNSRDLLLNFNRDNRLTTSDATARGARTSAGFQDDLADIRGQYDIDVAKNALQYNETMAGLVNAFNEGHINWKQTTDALEIARRRGLLDYEMAGKNHRVTEKELDSLAKTFGILDEKALADLGFARNDANNSYQAASASAAQTRASALQQMMQSRNSIMMQRAQDPMLAQLGAFLLPTSASTNSSAAAAAGAIGAMFGR